MNPLLPSVCPHRNRRSSRGNAFSPLSTVLLFVSLVACGDGAGVGVTPESSRDETWRADLAFLIERMESEHPDLYHSITRAEFSEAHRQLRLRIPTLTDAELFVEFLRLVALPARERDGHMALSYFSGTGNRIVPLQFYRFEDGVFVVRAKPTLQHLVGRRLVGIGDHELDQVDALIDPLIPRDNPQSLIGFRNLTYLAPDILAVLGIVEDARSPSYQLESAGGSVESVDVLSVAPDQYGMEFSYNLPTRGVAPLYLTQRDAAFWMTLLDGGRTLYLRLNEVRANSGSEDLVSFGRRVGAALDDGRVDRVILDLRQNNGGNNQLIDHILDFLSDERINSLVVFTDRNTFSAAGNLVAELEAETDAVFAGVSPGGSGSQFGDAERYTLPHSGLTVFIPTKRWVFGRPGFQPIQQPMDVTIEPTAADFFAGRDPVLAQYIGS